jgi:hypothetical protein
MNDDDVIDFEDLMEASVEHLEKDFYSNKFYFSYSSLSKLLWNPAVFYQLYVLELKEEKTESHLVQGKIIHALLLEEEKFNDLFIISPANLPTGSLRNVIDRVFYHHQELKRNGDIREKLEEFDDAILDIMKDMNYYQNLKTDQQRLDKIKTPDAFSYWGFLQMKGNKTLIDQESYDFCKSAVELIKTNKQVCRLIGCDTTEFDNREIFNEVPFQMELPDKPFGLKGIIDNIVIDHDQKIIYVNDIKTTSKELKDFPETIEFYNYWLQAIIYVSKTSLQYMHLLDNNYQLKFHFVVIDKSFQTYAFPVQESTLNTWLNRFKEVIDITDWHYTNRSYELPYQFAKGLVAL